MGIYSRMVEQDLKICQMVYELSLKDEELVVKNKEIEEKDNTIKQLQEKLFQFKVQYQDYKATCTKIIDEQRAENQKLQVKFDTLRSLSRVDHDAITELCDKLKVKDDKIEELSTKLAEVVMDNIKLVMDNIKHDDEVECWKDSIDRKNDYIDELHEQIEDLESIIEGQKENIADLENRIEKLKERLSPTSDKEATKGPDKMPDYEGFRKTVEEAHRKMMEEYKKLSIPAFKLPDDYAKGIWEALFNE